MKLKDKCITLSQAQKLKELGIQQDLSPGDCYWATLSNGTEILLLLSEQEDLPHAMYHPCKAFDVADLGIMLPRNYASFFCGFDLWRIANTFHYAENYTALHGAVTYTGQLTTFTNITGSSEAEVRASLLIFLIEKKIYSVDDVNASLNFSNSK